MTYNEILGAFNNYMPTGVQDKVIVPIPVEDEHPEPVGPVTEFTFDSVAVSYNGGMDSFDCNINVDDVQGMDAYSGLYGQEAIATVTIPSAELEGVELTLINFNISVDQITNHLTMYISMDVEGTDCCYDCLMPYQQGGSVHGSCVITAAMYTGDLEPQFVNNITVNITDIYFVLD